MDDLTAKSPQDKSQISLTEDWEVKWWTKSLAISVDRLKEVVAEVGNSVSRVKEYLESHKQ